MALADCTTPNKVVSNAWNAIAEMTLTLSTVATCTRPWAPTGTVDVPGDWMSALQDRAPRGTGRPLTADDVHQLHDRDLKSVLRIG